MTDEVIMNATMGISSFGSTTSIGWGVTILVFLMIGLVIYLTSKNFRKFIYGGLTILVLAIPYKISRWIGTSTATGDYNPIKGFGWVVGFILVAIFVGAMISRTKFINNMEKMWDDKEPNSKSKSNSNKYKEVTP